MKHSWLLILLVVLYGTIYGQEPDTTSNIDKKLDLPEITVFAEELESENQAQSISGLLQSSNDIFVSTSGYVFGQTRFKVRGLGSENTSVLINGIPMNDRETGRAYWSVWGGLNDVTRNKEVESGIPSSDEAFGGIGGVTNIVTRASTFNKQKKITYSRTNRNYSNRLMLTYSTGEMKGGWYLTASGSHRWAQEGYVEGTFYDAWGYFLSVEKKINSMHSIGIVGFGAPNRRGRNSVSIQEAYDLTDNNYYNSYWGYQNGEKRNSRIGHYHSPTIMFNHYWTMSEKSKLTSSVYYQFGKNGSTALDWYDTSDPRPDYYRRFPSYEDEYLGYTADDKLYAWENDANYRQLDWDYFYFVNRKNLYTIEDAEGVEGNNVTGNLSQYIVEDRRNDRSNIGANFNFEHTFNDNITFISGLNLSWFKTRQYKVVDDLLGGDFYLNVDKFADRDNIDPSFAENDLDNPNRVIREGDVFGYDYTGNINNFNLFAQTNFNYAKLSYFISILASYDEFWRTGHMRNGKFPEDSYGDSEKQQFYNAGIKGGMTYKITGRHMIDFNGMYMTRAPYFRTSYVSARTRNQVLDNLTNEKVMSADLSYIVRTRHIKGRASVYVARFEDQLYSRSYYHDVLRSFVNYQMSGVDIMNVGTEIGLEGDINSNFTLFGVVATGQNYYDSRPVATISVDNSAQVISNRTIYLKDYRVGGAPQTAMSGGLKYFSQKLYIYGGVSVNYYDDIYVNLNPDRRSAYAVANFASDLPEREAILEQEKLDPGMTMDLYIGKSWRIDYKYYISLNFSVNNLLNVQDFAFGGYEQYRYDPFEIDKFPNRYFYLYGRQFYLNLNFRF